MEFNLNWIQRGKGIHSPLLRSKSYQWIRFAIHKNDNCTKVDVFYTSDMIANDKGKKPKHQHNCIFNDTAKVEQESNTGVFPIRNSLKPLRPSKISIRISNMANKFLAETLFKNI